MPSKRVKEAKKVYDPWDSYIFDQFPKKKEKSLGILCKQFIHQFITWQDVISLEEAARQISKKDIEEQKLKTKIRRLYDIANVL